MTTHHRPIPPVPVTPAHRRSWRTLWRRCSCGLAEPCVDRLTMSRPLPVVPAPLTPSSSGTPQAPFRSAPPSSLPGGLRAPFPGGLRISPLDGLRTPSLDGRATPFGPGTHPARGLAKAPAPAGSTVTIVPSATRTACVVSSLPAARHASGVAASPRRHRGAEAGRAGDLTPGQASRARTVTCGVGLVPPGAGA